MILALIIIAIIVLGISLWIKKSTKSSDGMSYWESYKLKNAQKANAIKTVTGMNLDACSDIDVKQIISTIERWSENSNCEISDLKKEFLDSLLKMIRENNGLNLDFVLDDIKKRQMQKEADTFHIKQDNTICRFMIDAIVEYQQSQMTNAFKQKMADNLNLTQEQLNEIEETERKLNLAPDISKNDNIENRLFHLAENCVSRLSEEFRPLNSIGRAEALTFFSTLIVDLGEIKNDVDMDIMEDKYKLLLCDELFTEFEVDDFFNFINDRTQFYIYQYQKIKRERSYTPMFIYNAFYMHPGCMNPDHLTEFNESPFTLLELQAKLYELEDYINHTKLSLY